MCFCCFFSFYLFSDLVGLFWWSQFLLQCAATNVTPQEAQSGAYVQSLWWFLQGSLLVSLSLIYLLHCLPLLASYSVVNLHQFTDDGDENDNWSLCIEQDSVTSSCSLTLRAIGQLLFMSLYFTACLFMYLFVKLTDCSFESLCFNDGRIFT